MFYGEFNDYFKYIPGFVILAIIHGISKIVVKYATVFYFIGILVVHCWLLYIKDRSFTTLMRDFSHFTQEISRATRKIMRILSSRNANANANANAFEQMMRTQLESISAPHVSEDITLERMLRSRLQSNNTNEIVAPVEVVVDITDPDGDF